MASMSDISVLVVEDDPQTLATVAQAIAREPGLHLLAAVETAREAETCLANFVPDVLLTDLGLPDGSGIDLIQLCAARHPRCDAMVITMFADERNVTAAALASTSYPYRQSPADLARQVAVFDSQQKWDLRGVRCPGVFRLDGRQRQ